MPFVIGNDYKFDGTTGPDKEKCAFHSVKLLVSFKKYVFWQWGMEWLGWVKGESADKKGDLGRRETARNFLIHAI